LFVSKTTQKNTRPTVTKFSGKVAHGPRKRKKGLDLGGNPDRVTLGLRLGYVTVRWRTHYTILDLYGSESYAATLYMF